MSSFCEHETFKDVCGICHRNSVIEKQSSEIERLRAALRYALENGVCTQYWGDDDDCGTHGCCGEVSYKPHDAECWTVKARAALEDK